jgi:hypothetical protein
MFYYLLEGHTEEESRNFSKAIIELHLFQKYFTPATPHLKPPAAQTTPAHAS